jgi:uncharacterized protein (TIGR03437 family)
LGGIRLHLRDRSTGDKLAPLLYVSPTQINYVLRSTDPFAWVGIERIGSPYVPKGVAVPISTLAPSLFSVGQGVAAANAVRITTAGQVAVSVASCTGSVCSAVPIDVSDGPVYLSLYGTGFALASTAGSTCTLNTTGLPATYSGPQGQFTGLDQVNVLLPASLAGAGMSVIFCFFVAEGTPLLSSNYVFLDIQ